MLTIRPEVNLGLDLIGSPHSVIKFWSKFCRVSSMSKLESEGLTVNTSMLWGLRFVVDFFKPFEMPLALLLPETRSFNRFSASCMFNHSSFVCTCICINLSQESSTLSAH